MKKSALSIRFSLSKQIDSNRRVRHAIKILQHVMKKKKASSSQKLPRAKKSTVILDAEIAKETPKKDLVIEVKKQQETQTAIEPSSRAISPNDPLRQYLEEVKRHPLLSPEEEIELVQRMTEKGDIEAAKRLVSANLRLVVKIAFEYRSVYANVMDLIQEGNIGLMKAVSKYDPSKGARLGYYSTWWIRSYILKYLLDNFRLVKVGTTQAQKKLFYHLMREKQRLEAQGLDAGPKLLAQKLDVKESEVVEMQQRLGSTGAEMSIDTPIRPDSSSTATHGDLIVDESANQTEEKLIENELLHVLTEEIPTFRDSLNEKEKVVLDERILSEDPKTLQEIGTQYSLTRERVRQIEKKIIDKLRMVFEKKLNLKPDSQEER
ncbi:MAG: RNA polymerase subunit sigma-70 [Bdellovibrionaceae bacterium]|nr:RNA polymerase subunit sigma-70 [Pseudobdellovibrionaceae bacterium]